MDNTLSYFDDVPIAAASLGQVHKAILKDTNETVVIKIQRSKLRELYDKDLKLMKYIATNADKTVAYVNKLNAKKKNKNYNGNADADDYTGMNQNYTEIFVDAETILYREINYTMEALNTIQFANDFGIGYGGLPLESNNEQSSSSNDDKVVLEGASSWIRVPYIYKKYSTEKVLVMEYVPSIKINDFETLREKYDITNDQLEYVSVCLARSYLRQFCNNLFFSTDPHPGNLGIEFIQQENDKTLKPRLVFYDFGQACYLDKEQGEGILNVIEGIIDRDAKSCVDAFIKMGVLLPDADLDIVQRKVQNNFDTGYIKVKNKRINKKKNQNQVPFPKNDQMNDSNETEEQVKDSEVMKYFTLPAEYAFVARAITQMDGVGKGLDPDFDFISACAPYIVEIKGTDVYVKDSIRKKLIMPVLDMQSNIFKSLGFSSIDAMNTTKTISSVS